MSAASQNLRDHQEQADMDGCMVKVSRQAVEETLAQHEAMLGALLLLTGNPHINLGDCIYQVREREGKGWDGPAVLAWSQGITAAEDAIKMSANSGDA